MKVVHILAGMICFLGLGFIVLLLTPDNFDDEYVGTEFACTREISRSFDRPEQSPPQDTLNQYARRQFSEAANSQPCDAYSAKFSEITPISSVEAELKYSTASGTHSHTILIPKKYR